MRTPSIFIGFASAVAIFGSACVTTPEKKPDSDPVARAETPEVPIQPKQPTEHTEPVTAAPAPAAPVNVGPAPEPVKAVEVPATPVKPAFDARLAARFKEGTEYIHKGDDINATKAFNDVVSENPKAAYAFTNLGILDERRGDSSAAEKNYRKALGVDVAQDVAWDNLTRLSCRENRCSQIEGELRNTIAQNPSAIGARNGLVYSLLHQNKLDAAASEAKKVLKADERNVRAMQLLAQIYFKESKVELARLVLENARTIDVNDAATHNALGLVQLQLKQRPQALESFRQASLLKPDFAEARNNFGAMLNDGNDYESAAKELEAAIAAQPKLVSAHLNLANAYRGLQNVPKALAQYELVKQAKPELADTYFNLGILHLDQEVPGIDAVAKFKAAIAYFGDYKSRGGKDERIDQYIKDANKGIDKEERKREREKKDQLKKAGDAAKAEADAKKKAEDDAAAKAKAEADGKAKAEADAKKAAENPPAVGGGKLGGDEK